MKTYTIEQIKTYIASCDSLGDALYYCDEAHIDKAIHEKEHMYDDVDEYDSSEDTNGDPNYDYTR